jgi:hypothetical protein
MRQRISLYIWFCRMLLRDRYRIRGLFELFSCVSTGVAQWTPQSQASTSSTAFGSAHVCSLQPAPSLETDSLTIPIGPGMAVLCRRHIAWLPRVSIQLARNDICMFMSRSFWICLILLAVRPRQLAFAHTVSVNFRVTVAEHCWW